MCVVYVGDTLLRIYTVIMRATSNCIFLMLAITSSEGEILYIIHSRGTAG